MFSITMVNVGHSTTPLGKKSHLRHGICIPREMSEKDNKIKGFSESPLITALAADIY